MELLNPIRGKPTLTNTEPHIVTKMTMMNNRHAAEPNQPGGVSFLSPLVHPTFAI